VAGVVVDTSAWIDFFAGRKSEQLEEALSIGSAVVPPIVVAELIAGAVSPEQVQAIGELLQDVPIHETPLEHWIDVGDLRRTLTRKGINVTIPDAHVAQCALDRNAVLIASDAVFTRIAAHTRLRLRH
jgi:predicted nucleic acid-binding protein